MAAIVKKFATNSVFGEGEGEFSVIDFAKFLAADFDLITIAQAGTLTAYYLSVLKAASIPSLTKVLAKIPSEALTGILPIAMVSLSLAPLTADQFSVFTADQISALTSIQIASLTSKQLGYLVPEQFGAISVKSLA